MKLSADKIQGDLKAETYNAYVYDSDGDAGNRLPFEVHAKSAADLDKRVALLLAMPDAYEALNGLVTVFTIYRENGKAELSAETFEFLKKQALDVLKKAGLR